jgi:polyphenol oxidase
MHGQGPLQPLTPHTSKNDPNTPPENLLFVRTAEGLESFSFLHLKAHGLIHGVFTRRGGVSDTPFHTLNLSYAVGDRPEAVTENLGKLRGTLSATRLIYLNQSHGVDILIPGEGTEAHAVATADALITRLPGTALLIKQADCQAVILFDPRRGVAANVHCGWRGNVANLLGRVVSRMKEEFSCKGSDILAAIGPSLGPCCAEFVGYKEIFPDSFRGFMVRENHFDLWSLSSTQLIDAGVRRERIEVAGLCTRCRTDLFYSYRKEGNTGRFGTVAMLPG